MGEEVRYVSDWSRMIHDDLKQKITRGQETALTADTRIQMIDCEKKKFVDVGFGTLRLSGDGFCLDGQLNGGPLRLSVPTQGIPTLPFSPGKYLEIQHGRDIYRCVPEDGRLVMKFINMVKILYELSRQKEEKVLKSR